MFEQCMNFVFKLCSCPHRQPAPKRVQRQIKSQEWLHLEGIYIKSRASLDQIQIQVNSRRTLERRHRHGAPNNAEIHGGYNWGDVKGHRDISNQTRDRGCPKKHTNHGTLCIMAWLIPWWMRPSRVRPHPGRIWPSSGGPQPPLLALPRYNSSFEWGTSKPPSRHLDAIHHRNGFLGGVDFHTSQFHESLIVGKNRISYNRHLYRILRITPIQNMVNNFNPQYCE